MTRSRPNTKLFFTESPTNPYLRVIDVPETVRVCHAKGVEVVIDSTFATPINHKALGEGADYVVHSATKYLGRSQRPAGRRHRRQRRRRSTPVRKAVGVLGGILDPHAAYLLLRGLKTLALRMQRHNENGIRVAQWLEAHSAVSRVWYPGLASHPDHDTAKTQMQGFGGVVTFELDCDLDAALRFTDACKMAYIAPSLGGVETLIESPAVMSFWDRTPEDRAKLGITDGAHPAGLRHRGLRRHHRGPRAGDRRDLALQRTPPRRNTPPARPGCEHARKHEGGAATRGSAGWGGSVSPVSFHATYSWIEGSQAVPTRTLPSLETSVAPRRSLPCRFTPLPARKASRSMRPVAAVQTKGISGEKLPRGVQPQPPTTRSPSPETAKA